MGWMDETQSHVGGGRGLILG